MCEWCECRTCWTHLTVKVLQIAPILRRHRKNLASLLWRCEFIHNIGLRVVPTGWNDDGAASCPWSRTSSFISRGSGQVASPVRSAVVWSRSTERHEVPPSWGRFHWRSAWQDTPTSQTDRLERHQQGDRHIISQTRWGNALKRSHRSICLPSDDVMTAWLLLANTAFSQLIIQ